MMAEFDSEKQSEGAWTLVNSNGEEEDEYNSSSSSSSLDFVKLGGDLVSYHHHPRERTGNNTDSDISSCSDDDGSESPIDLSLTPKNTDTRHEELPEAGISHLPLLPDNLSSSSRPGDKDGQVNSLGQIDDGSVSSTEDSDLEIIISASQEQVDHQPKEGSSEDTAPQETPSTSTHLSGTPRSGFSEPPCDKKLPTVVADDEFKLTSSSTASQHSYNQYRAHTEDISCIPVRSESDSGSDSDFSHVEPQSCIEDAGQMSSDDVQDEMVSSVGEGFKFVQDYPQFENERGCSEQEKVDLDEMDKVNKVENTRVCNLNNDDDAASFQGYEDDNLQRNNTQDHVVINQENEAMVPPIEQADQHADVLGVGLNVDHEALVPEQVDPVDGQQVDDANQGQNEAGGYDVADPGQDHGGQDHGGQGHDDPDQGHYQGQGHDDIRQGQWEVIEHQDEAEQDGDDTATESGAEDDRIESDQSEDMAADADDNDLSFSNIGLENISLHDVTRRKQYVHEPNPSLSSTLSLIVIMAGWLALGLGIGHSIGSARLSGDSSTHMLWKDPLSMLDGYHNLQSLNRQKRLWKIEEETHNRKMNGQLENIDRMNTEMLALQSTLKIMEGEKQKLSLEVDQLKTTLEEHSRQETQDVKVTEDVDRNLDKDKRGMKEEVVSDCTLTDSEPSSSLEWENQTEKLLEELNFAKDQANMWQSLYFTERHRQNKFANNTPDLYSCLALFTPNLTSVVNVINYTLATGIERLQNITEMSSILNYTSDNDSFIVHEFQNVFAEMSNIWQNWMSNHSNTFPKNGQTKERSEEKSQEVPRWSKSLGDILNRTQESVSRVSKEIKEKWKVLKNVSQDMLKNGRFANTNSTEGFVDNISDMVSNLKNKIGSKLKSLSRNKGDKRHKKHKQAFKKEVRNFFKDVKLSGKYPERYNDKHSTLVMVDRLEKFQRECGSYYRKGKIVAQINCQLKWWKWKSGLDVKGFTWKKCGKYVFKWQTKELKSFKKRSRKSLDDHGSKRKTGVDFDGPKHHKRIKAKNAQFAKTKRRGTKVARPPSKRHRNGDEKEGSSKKLMKYHQKSKQGRQQNSKKGGRKMPVVDRDTGPPRNDSEQAVFNGKEDHDSSWYIRKNEKKRPVGPEFDGSWFFERGEERDFHRNRPDDWYFRRSEERRRTSQTYSSTKRQKHDKNVDGKTKYYDTDDDGDDDDFDDNIFCHTHSFFCFG